MLSARIVSARQAGTYYEKDNYYTQQLGEYRGKLKEELALDDLTHATFQRLVYGYHPATGEALKQKKSKLDNDRAAVDLTFTAPKSFSVALELAIGQGDTKLAAKLQELHDTAVNRTLDYVEENQSKTRVQTKGKRREITTGKMLFAKFQHDTSRELDPLLHTHCLGLNFTIDKYGKFRSLEPKDILKSVKQTGLIYRNELAKLAKEAGLDITQTCKKNHFFELTKVPKSLLEASSSRTAQVEELFAKLKKQYPDARESVLMQNAKIGSRKPKKNVDRDEVRAANMQNFENAIGKKELNTLLAALRPKHHPSFGPKIEESKEYKQALTAEVKRIRATIPRAQWRGDYKALEKTLSKNFGDVSVSAVMHEIKRQDQVERAAMGTMEKVLMRELEKSKLNTQEFFRFIEKTPKQKLKQHIEERIENVKDHRITTRRANNRRERVVDRTHQSGYEHAKTAGANYRTLGGTTTERDGGVER